MSSLVARLPPRFPSLALCTANDGKLDSARGTRLMISHSAYELRYVHLSQAAQTSPHFCTFGGWGLAQTSHVDAVFA